MQYERITSAAYFDGLIRDSHEYRYKVASSYALPSDIILDVACGTGYGRKFFSGLYIGVDTFESHEFPLDGYFLKEDLNYWVPDFAFDFAVSFETVEHLTNYQNLIEILRRSRRMVFLSSPIVPTKHRNKFHVNDFTYDELEEMMGDGWQIIHSEIQDKLYGIVGFVRKT